MKIYTFILSILLIFTFTQCKNDIQEEKKIDPILQDMGGDNYQDLIRIPVEADGNIDTSQVAKILFETKEYDLGTMKLGEKRSHTFKFQSVGRKDLYILSAESSCGCTVPSFSDEAIKPGEFGEIHITFDSANRSAGEKEKVIVVKANTIPNIHELKIFANVVE